MENIHFILNKLLCKPFCQCDKKWSVVEVILMTKWISNIFQTNKLYRRPLKGKKDLRTQFSFPFQQETWQCNFYATTCPKIEKIERSWNIFFSCDWINNVYTMQILFTLQCHLISEKWTPKIHLYFIISQLQFLIQIDFFVGSKFLACIHFTYLTFIIIYVEFPYWFIWILLLEEKYWETTEICK